MALKESLFRVVVESSMDGLLVIDDHGIVKFANPAAVALFEGKTNQLVGFELGSPAIRGPVEIIIITSGASIRYLEMRSTDILWNETDASLASLRDITEHRKAQEALLERNSELVRFSQLGVERELRMIELKREVNELCLKLGEAPRHRIAGDSDPASLGLENNF